MATTKKVKIKRYNGTDWDAIYPVTSYNNLTDLPATFAPSSHTHSQYLETTGGTLTGRLTINANTDTPFYIQGNSNSICDIRFNNSSGTDMAYLSGHSDGRLYSYHDSAYHKLLEINDITSNIVFYGAESSSMSYDPYSRNLSCNSGSGNWNKGAYSSNGYKNNILLSFIANSTGAYSMIGLSKAPNTIGDYDDINYCIYLNGDNSVYAYESGSQADKLANSFSIGDSFAITYNNNTIKYYKNGEVVRTVNNVTLGTNELFYFDSSFYYYGSKGGSIKDLYFGPSNMSNYVRTSPYYALDINGRGMFCTSNTDTPLNLKGNSTNTYMEFQNSSGSTLGYYGVNASHHPIFYVSGDKNILLEGEPTTMDYVTSAPTSSNTYGIKVAILSSEPSTKYSGWLYIITS